MKLSFTTLGCPDWSFEKVLHEAQTMGFDGIEIRGMEGKMLAEEIAQFFPENKQATLDALKAHGLVMCGFGTSVRFDNADQFDAVVAEGKRAIDVCARMGIPAIRVFGDGFPEGETEASVIARAARGISLLCAYGAEKGIDVYLETHGQFNTLERIQGVCDGVPYANFGILWDVAHTDKTYGDDFMAFYGPMKSRIRHVHFKDHKRDGAFTLCRVGMGDIPLKTIARTLRDDGYQGFISLEWEKKWHPDLPDAEVAYPDFVKLMAEI